MFTSIDVKFTFHSARLRVVQLRKYSPNSRCRPTSCLLAVLAMFLAIFWPSSYSWNEWNVRHFFKFTTKTTQPRPQVFSVNGALTCKNAAFLTSFVMVNYACSFSQSESRKYFELIIKSFIKSWGISTCLTDEIFFVMHAVILFCFVLFVCLFVCFSFLL